MMTQRWEKTIEAYFDGDTAQEDAAKALMADRPECAAYYAQLQALRQGVAAVAAKESIGDAQFPAFMAGVREGIEARPQRSHRGLWAAASLTAAALVLTVATLSIFTGGPEPVAAGETEIDFFSTELDDATVNVYNAENGVTTIQLQLPEDDI